MKRLKVISTLTTATLLIGFTTLSIAHDLKMSNATRYDLSFSINNTCSKSFGVLKQDTIKVIKRSALQTECASTPNDCIIKVYSKPSCNGQYLEYLSLDLNQGLIGVYGQDGNPEIRFATALNRFNLLYSTSLT